MARYWKCLNSWGADWGANNNGEFYMRRGVSGQSIESNNGGGFWAHAQIVPDVYAKLTGNTYASCEVSHSAAS